MKNTFKRIIYFLGIAFLISSCVPKSDYESLKSENEQLKKELEDCKFGAERLLKQAQTQYDNKEYDNCVLTVAELEKRHPGSNEFKIGLDLKKKAELAKERQIAAEKRAEAERIQKEKQRLANATSKMRKSYDDMNGITWYYDKTSPKYTNYNGFYAYIGKEKTGNPWLRLRIQYAADDWLFIEKYIIKVDDVTYTIVEEKYGEIETDNGSGGIWEWLDRGVDSDEYQIIKAVANGKNVKIRFVGKQYHKDKSITSAEKLALRNVLDAYEALGGTLK